MSLMHAPRHRRAASAHAQPHVAPIAWLSLAALPLLALLLASCAEAPRVALTAVEAQDIAECRLIEALDDESAVPMGSDSFRRCLALKGY